MFLLRKIQFFVECSVSRYILIPVSYFKKCKEKIWEIWNLYVNRNYLWQQQIAFVALKRLTTYYGNLYVVTKPKQSTANIKDIEVVPQRENLH
jgi:hypothetical protein